MNPVVFLVDDEPQVREFLATNLEREGFKVLAFEGAEEALVGLRGTRPDLIVSDVEMHRMDGIALCRQLKGDPGLAAIPIILISGRRIAISDQVDGLNHGADEYLLKPVPVKLLASRIRSLLRHATGSRPARRVLRWNIGEVDLVHWIVTVEGTPVELTAKEFALLVLLLQHRGEVVTHREILDQVWGVDPARLVDTDTLKTHVSSLRHKVGAATGGQIESVWGVGYRFMS